MGDPATSTFVFCPSGRMLNLNNSADEWTFTIDKKTLAEGSTAVPFETCDIYVTLRSRNSGSSEPIKALFMSYFLVEEKIFYPGVKVKLTLATCGIFIFAARITYPNDQDVLKRFNMKGVFVPGDGCNLCTDAFDISTYDNNYHLRTLHNQTVHIFYTDKYFSVKHMTFMCDSNKMTPITPHDISLHNRYLHILYFKRTHNSTESMTSIMQAMRLVVDTPKRETSASPSSPSPSSSSPSPSSSSSVSKHLCLICLEREANQLLVPCYHICYCENCTKKSQPRITECPICRRRVDCRERVFFPL